MEVVDKKSHLWQYLAEDQRELILDGEQLLTDVVHFKSVSDYSFLVFPFSKAYEGFLKQLFLDLDLIKEDEYYGDSIRIGRILNPMFMKEHTSIYQKLCLHDKGGADVTDKLWQVWKKGRNQVFHYFPHNYRKLSFDEALGIIKEEIEVMTVAAAKCDISLP
ncbi:MAG: hypothetical protein ACOZAO_00340 [Patescibacteria group bacterium]